MKYPEVTVNMVGPSITLSRSKEKQPIVSSDESDTEPEGVYQHPRTGTGVIALVDYMPPLGKRGSNKHLLQRGAVP